LALGTWSTKIVVIVFNRIVNAQRLTQMYAVCIRHMPWTDLYVRGNRVGENTNEGKEN